MAQLRHRFFRLIDIRPCARCACTESAFSASPSLCSAWVCAVQRLAGVRGRIPWIWRQFVIGLVSTEHTVKECKGLPPLLFRICLGLGGWFRDYLALYRIRISQLACGRACAYPHWRSGRAEVWARRAHGQNKIGHAVPTRAHRKWWLLLLDPGLSLTTYQFSYTLDILFHSDSPRLSATGLPRDRVRCVNLAQKVSNRTNCPILVRKLFTNMFCTPSLFLTKEFNRQFIFVHERHVYQQTVT